MWFFVNKYVLTYKHHQSYIYLQLFEDKFKLTSGIGSAMDCLIINEFDLNLLLIKKRKK